MYESKKLISLLEDELDAGWEQYVEIRHHLHEYPEKSNEEKETAAYIISLLHKSGISCRENVGGFGIVADISAPGGKTAIALRADMDALAIQENTGLPFSSRIDGVMHACGHDVHMAALLIAGHILQRHRDKLPGNVRLIFQPAEENGPVGGARPMIDSGALEGADIQAVFAAHVSPQLPLGRFFIAQGPALAANDNFFVTVTGKGGHAANPCEAVNPLIAASRLLLEFSGITAQEISAQHAAVVSIGCLKGGIRRNIIPECAEMEGTMRTVCPQDREKLHRRMEEIARGVAISSGADINLMWVPSFDMADNDSRMSAFLRHSISGYLGEDALESKQLGIMASDDFAYFLKEKPGAMFWVGSNTGTEQQLHSPTLNISDDTVKNLCRAFLIIAVEYFQYFNDSEKDDI